MGRRKSAPVNAPSTTAEATALLGEYAKGVATIDHMRAHYDAIITDLQAERDKLVEPIESGLKDLFISLRAWWAVAGDSVTDGKRKTAEIAGCLVGLRINTPSLKLAKDKTADQLVNDLDDAALFDFIIRSAKLNKPTIIQALRGPADPVKAALLDLGFTTSQTEQFFIDRLKPEGEAEDPQTIPDESIDRGEPA
jgi:phage host-nuclease inhibitor protein Gam